MGSKRKPSSLYVAQVEWVEREMLMSSKRGELLEQCLREYRGTTSLNHPTDAGKQAMLPFPFHRRGNCSPERFVLQAQVTQPGVMANLHNSAIHFIGGAVILVDR